MNIQRTMRWDLSHDDTTLVGIAGGGRIKVERRGSSWWEDPRKIARPWKVVPAEDGLFESRERAEEVATNLKARQR